MGTALLLLGIVAFVGLAFYLNDPAANKLNRDAAADAKRASMAAIVCPHCQAKGSVKVSMAKRKQGISGGKAAAGLVTGGASLFAVGLSRKQSVRRMTCSTCRMEWDVA